MARTLRTFAWMMTSLVALAGTATAGASLVGGVDASVTSDHASANAGGDVAADYQDGELPTVDGALEANAAAEGHDASVSADTDGNAAATVDDHTATANVDVDEPRAAVSVDDVTVSTDDIGATDVPGVPDVDGSFEFNAMIDAMIDAGEDLMVALSAAVTAFLEW